MVKGTFTITCYGKTTTYPESERSKQMAFYRDAFYNSEGSERNRYALIWSQLFDGDKHCSDE